MEWLISQLAGWFGPLPLLSPEQAASLQGYASVAQALLAIVATAISTLAAFFAGSAWIAARSQRYDTLMPLLEVSVSANAASCEFWVVLTNVGVGPAINVVAKIPRSASSGLTWSYGSGDRLHPDLQLVPMGDRRFVHFVENRFRDFRDVEAAVPAQVKGNHSGDDQARERARDYDARIRPREVSILTAIAAHPLFASLTIEYRDVYGRPFTATARLEDDFDRGPTPELRRMIRVVGTQHTFPHRRRWVRWGLARHRSS